MKPIRLLLFLALLSMTLVSCDSGPQVGGKPLSHWIAALEDQSGSTVDEALGMIAQVDKSLAEPARMPLARVAESGKNANLRGRAAVVYFQKFDEVKPSSIDPLFHLLRYEDDRTYFLASSRALSTMTEHADEIVPKAIEIILSDEETLSMRGMSATQVLKGMGKPALDALERLPRQKDAMKQVEIESAIDLLRDGVAP